MEYTVSNHRHYTDFTIVPNVILRNEKMTFFEKGLLCYLLSLPADWEIHVGYIASTFGESERAILKGLKGLIEFGYCRRTARRKDGKLSGQHYQITDIANDFSAPSKNEGAEPAAHQVSRPAGIPAPQKNDGADKEYTLFDEENIPIEKEKRASTPVSTRERKCLFADSKFFDFETFRAQFTGPEFIDVDLYYYHQRLTNWSGSSDGRKSDWILTAKNWMMDDNEAGKLKKIKPAGVAGGLTQDEIDYLKEMSHGIWDKK